LDVGVGTGYFLDHCRFPSHTPRVALMDLNRNSLDFASRRLTRYKPETYIRNVLEPVSIDAAKFDSVGINYLLHCLPGTIESKWAALDHLKTLIRAVHLVQLCCRAALHAAGLRNASWISTTAKGYSRMSMMTPRV
jgi:Methyltransferase domain